MDRTGYCSSCGRELFPDDTFCSQCGTRVQEGSSRTGFSRRTQLRKTISPQDRRACGSCNSLLLVEEVFCPTCGARAGTTPPTGQAAGEAQLPGFQKLEEATRGKFEFIRELGRGGMGTVHLARELDLDRLVAIKALSSNWLTDESMVERFRREARVVASLRHPSIVHVHGVGQAEDIHYFVMDFIDGVSLGSILRTLGRMSIPAVQAVFFEVGSALSYAHRPGRGVIHRDIKPSNIMVDGEGNSFVTDFGISKVAEGQSGLTLTGLIMGTPEFMSPEQCRGDVATFSSDQYALGVVVYAMLTGTPPFSGTHYRVLTGHTAEDPPPIHDFRSDCPKKLADVVYRMLAKQPGERWPGISDALKAAGVQPLMPDDPAQKEMGELVAQTVYTQTQQRVGGRREKVRVEGREERTPTTLRILAPQRSLETGDEVRFRATAILEGGEEIVGQSVTWDSTDPGVAQIDPTTGELVAVGAGSVVITAWTAGIAESIAVEVSPPRVAQLAIEPEWMEIEVGAMTQLTARAMSRRGSVLEHPVLWSSSDPTTATVTKEGVVLAHEVGPATVLAHCEGVGAAARVSVIPATVASVQLTGVPSALRVGESTALHLEIRDSRDGLLHRPVFWSTSEPGVAQISDTGLLRAEGQGLVRITAECGGQGASTTITVLPAPVARVEVEVKPSTPSVTPSLPRAPQDSETGTPSYPDTPSGDAEYQARRPTVAWVGEKILPPPAVVPAKEQTKRQLVWLLPIAAFVVGGGLWMTLGLNQAPPPVTPVVGDLTVVTASGLPTDPVLHLVTGDSLALVASATTVEGTQVLDPDVLWGSTNRDLATVDSDGRLVALAAGALRITVRVGDHEEEFPVSITEPLVDLAKNPEGLSVPQQQFVETEPDQPERERTPTPEGGTPPPLADPPPPNGDLDLRIIPWARVLIDDTLYGDTVRVLQVSLSPGNHRLQLQNSGLDLVPFDTLLVIGSNARTELAIRMQRKR